MRFSIYASAHCFLEVLAILGTLLRLKRMLFTWTFTLHLISVGEIEALETKEMEKWNCYAKLKKSRLLLLYDENFNPNMGRFFVIK